MSPDITVLMFVIQSVNGDAVYVQIRVLCDAMAPIADMILETGTMMRFVVQIIVFHVMLMPPKHYVHYV